MKKRVTYRPSKPSAALSGVMGVIFVILGLTVVIPDFGLFGLLWTGIAVAIAIGNLYRAFGKKYMGPEIRIEEDDSTAVPQDAESPSPAAPKAAIGLDAKGRLEQLDRLKEAGLLTQEEYSTKRSEIIDQL